MRQNRTVKFLMNSGSLALQQIITLAAGFIVPRVMLLFYGSDTNGLVTSVTQIITYINLVEAGLSNAATYALYKPLADRDHAAVSAVVSASRKFYLQTGYIFMALVGVLAVAYPLYIQSEVLSVAEVGLLVLFMGLNGALEFITLAKYRVLLTADQKTYVVSAATMIYTVLNTVIVVVMANFGAGIVAVKAVALTSMCVRSLILTIYCRKHYAYLDYHAKPNKKALNKRWDALLLQILGVVHRGAPALLITAILKDLKLVSVYTVFNMVIGGLNNVMSIFKTGVSASFGEVIAQGETKTLQKSYGEFEYIYYKLVSVIYATAFVMIMPFVRLYTAGVTDTNYDLPLVGFLFVLDGVLYNLKTPPGMLFMAAGMYKETRFQNFMEAAIMVVVGIVLAKPLGIVGILLASILSNLYRAIELMFFVPRRITKMPVRYTFKRIALMLISIFAAVLPWAFIRIEVSGYLMWVVFAVAVVAVAGVVSLLIGVLFERNELQSVLRRVIRIVKRKIM